MNISPSRKMMILEKIAENIIEQGNADSAGAPWVGDPIKLEDENNICINIDGEIDLLPILDIVIRELEKA